MECKDIRDLVPAYVDGEVGLPELVEIERHLQTCPTCGDEHASLASLRAAIKRNAVYFQAPDRLERRVRAALPASAPSKPQARWGRAGWWNVGVSVACAITLAWSAALYLALPSTHDRLAEEVVASHVRSLLSNRAIDVASSDQHTVKPWFGGKLEFSPPVHDLATEGFALVGGRVDYLDHQRVAALVYRHRLHAINLYIAPARTDKDTAAQNASKEGYYLVHWMQRGMSFWAISDIDPEQMNKFREALSKHIES
jgi:anti-sigma factor RsiW